MNLPRAAASSGPSFRPSRASRDWLFAGAGAGLAVLAALRDAVGRGWSPAALGWKLGAEGGRDAVLLRAALLESPLPTDWQTDVARGAASVMPVTAIDLMPDLQGAALGARLKEIEARWLASDLRLTRADFWD